MLVVIVAFAAGACKGSAGGDAAGPAAVAVPPGPGVATAPSGGATGMNVVEKPSELPVGGAVHVCWRAVPPGNPFLAKGPFDCGTTVTLVAAPWGSGDVSGTQLLDALAGKPKGKVGEVRIRAEAPGSAPGDPSASMMTAERGDSEFYGKYVVKTDDGAFRVFLDVEVEGGEG